MSCMYFTDWTVFIVGKLSPWINMDSDLADIRTNSEKVNLYVKEIQDTHMYTYAQSQ